MRNSQALSISDNKLLELMSDAESKLEGRLSSITNSIGLMDFILDMSNMWQSDSFPIQGEESFKGDKAKFYIFRNMMKLCKLELTRRRVIVEAKDEQQYLASIIRANKLLTNQEVKIAL